MIELDVQLTRDGEVVVMHDWTLERTTDGAGAVCDRTLAEIRRLDAGAWFGPAFRGTRVPTLAEVLAAVGLPVNVELKPVGDDGLEARALEVVESAGALARVVFSSFDAGALERLCARTTRATLAVLWDEGPVADAVARARRVGARALHLRKDREPIASAIRRFKKQCEKAGILAKLRKSEHYEKPSVRRKKKAMAARKRALRRASRTTV